VRRGSAPRGGAAPPKGLRVERAGFAVGLDRVEISKVLERDGCASVLGEQGVVELARVVDGRGIVDLLRLRRRRDGRLCARRGLRGVATEGQEQLIEFLPRELLGTAAEAEPIGAHHDPGESLIGSLEARHGAHHLVERFGAAALRKHPGEACLQPLQARLPLDLEVRIERYVGGHELCG